MSCKSELRDLVETYGLNFIKDALDEIEDDTEEESAKIAEEERHNEYISQADRGSDE
jgi:hypothetical protein